MPATLTDAGTGISCVFSDASTAEFSLDAPGAPLGRDLLVGLVELVHPHGTVDQASTVAIYVKAIRNMVDWLAARGSSGGAEELTATGLTEYWMSATGAQEACTRRMLRGFDTETGALSEAVHDLVAGRAFNLQPFRRALPPYPEAEWARLGVACQATIDASYESHREALAAAARGHDPATAGWNHDNLCWLLSRIGPSTLGEVAAHAGVPTASARERGGFGEASRALFPHIEVTVAYLLAFAMSSGVVPDGIGDLVVGDIDWVGDASILLSYIKGRTGPESVTLGRPAVRLLERWLSHSTLLRGFVGPIAGCQLWLGVTQGGRRVAAGPVHRNVIRRWALDHELCADDGGPLKIHRNRIRTTHQSLRDKRAWTGNGRATIDPNHTASVEGDHYLSATTPAQRLALDSIVEDAQHDLVRRAGSPTVLSEDDIVALAGAWPELTGGLGLDDAALAELVGGERDVFVAACADQLSGLHGPKGQPCPARPWVCLLCPLAVFAPRHATNLLALKAFFSRQWRAMPAGQFMAVFDPYAQRIDQVLAGYAPAVLSAAAARVADSDDELPLRPEEHST